MRLDVLTPVYGEGPYPSACVLDQLRSWDRWIVVDNNPEPRAAAWLPDDPRIVYIHEPRPGAYVARSTGLWACTADVVALLDSDCVPGPGWVERGLSWFLDGHKTVAGRVVTVNEGSALVERYDAATAIPQGLWELHKRICAGNLWVRRAVLQSAGGFSPSRKSGPDRSLPSRLKRQGGYVYDGSLAVTHPARSSWGSILNQVRRAASSTRLQDSWVDSLDCLARAFVPWGQMHVRLWRSGLPIRDRLLFLVIFQSIRCYWIWRYLRGGGEPSR